ncbi:hypothetical protein WEI85_24470 [Actinomycetes bacterium KLBMP 9797]
MSIDLWQIPVLVGAGIVILVYLVPLIAGWRPSPDPTPKPVGSVAAWLRTGILGALSVALLWILVITFQAWEASSAAANIATIASLVLEVAALRLTYLSYRENKVSNRERDPGKASPARGDEPATHRAPPG